MPAHTTLNAVPTGSDLLDSLSQMAKGGEAWFSATGEVEAVELRVAGDGADAVQRLEGSFTLLHLAGPSKGPFSVTLARMSAGGIVVLGGVLVRARSTGVTVAVQTAVVTAAVTAVPAPVTAVPVSVSTAPTWVKAAVASAAIAAREVADDVDEVSPEAGDLVDHFAFGLCEVVTSDGERLKLRDAKQPGRVREVSMTMLDLIQPTESDGKRLFRLARRGA